ncbi:MAG: ARPP-1 family domain-containing protein [Actinomycetota bacterium]
MTIQLTNRISIGRPITRQGVSLFPVYVHDGAGDRGVRGGGGQVVVEEREHAQVPTLVATNNGDTPAVLVEGETVVGGQQDRTINVSVLVPAGESVDIPVSCVQAGRWSGERRFRKGKTYASRRVRRVKQAGVGRNIRETGRKASYQGAVWHAIDDELARLRVTESTAAFTAADEVFERDGRLDSAVGELVGRGPLPGQRGVVVAHGRRVVQADVFATPEVLAEQWEALVRAYLLDAPERTDGTPSTDRVLRFLERFGTAESTEAPGVGLGTEHHVETDRLVGQALVWDDVLVHASAFALAE